MQSTSSLWVLDGTEGSHTEPWSTRQEGKPSQPGEVSHLENMSILLVEVHPAGSMTGEGLCPWSGVLCPLLDHG